MAVKVEVGTWTGSGSTPQTITLADAGFGTPIAIIVWTTTTGGDVPASGAFADGAMQAHGFGTRRGGTTQSGCMSYTLDDAQETTDARNRRSVDTLLAVMRANDGGGTLDYSVLLDSFGDAVFTVSYSSAAAASGDVFHYTILSGLDDAVVLNWTMDSVGATEVVTGTGFLPSAVIGLFSDGAEDISHAAPAVSLGCASSATRFWSIASTATSGDAMTSTQNWNRAIRTDAFLERLTHNADTSDARWDIDSFDSDGATLGVVDAPGATKLATLLFMKGGVWEAGTFAKSVTAVGGAQTVTLANSALTPVGLILATTNQTAVGIGTANAGFCVGAGSTPSTTRGSAVNNCVGITAPEADPTTCDRFRATDAIIEELTGGATPAETSQAWYRAAAAGSFEVEWANPNGTTAHLVGYLAVGSAAESYVPTAQPRSPVPVQHASRW